MDRLSVCEILILCYRGNLHWVTQNLRLGRMWPAGWT